MLQVFNDIFLNLNGLTDYILCLKNTRTMGASQGLYNVNICSVSIDKCQLF